MTVRRMIFAVLVLLLVMGPNGVRHLLRAASRGKERECWFLVSFALRQVRPLPVDELARLALVEAGDVRRLALEYLGSFGARARPVSMRLIPLLGSEDLPTRRETVYGLYLTDMCTLALEAAGPDAPKLLLEAVRTGSPRRAKAAVECLALLNPPTSEAVSELGRLAAGAGDRAVRLASLWSLRTLGRSAEAAAEALERAAGGSDVQFRIKAIVSLAAVTGRADAGVRRLTSELRSDDPKARLAAAWYLGDFQADGAPAVGALAAALSDEYWKVREWAAMSLGQIGPAAAPAVEPLSRLLLSRFESARAPADQLAMDGPEDTGTTQAEQAAALNRLEASVRDRAAWALAKIGKPDGRVRGLLLSCLTDERPAVRAAGARALGLQPAWAGATVPKLIPLLKDPDDSVRGATYLAFWRLGPAARQALEPLTQAMRREETRGNRITASIAVEEAQGK